MNVAVEGGPPTCCAQKEEELTQFVKALTCRYNSERLLMLYKRPDCSLSYPVNYSVRLYTQRMNKRNKN